MKIPNDYEMTSTFANGSATIPAGGYVCRIVEATENDQYGYLELKVDISEGEYKDYYAERYANQIAKGNSKPYFGGTLRLYPSKRDGSTNPMFKGAITSIEESNNVKLVKNGELELAALTGLYVGVLFGNCPYAAMNDQTRKYEKRDIIKPVMCMSVERIHSGRFTIPKERPMSDRDRALMGFKEAPAQQNDYDDLPF